VVEAIRAGRAIRVFAAKGTKETGGLRAVIEEAERSGVPLEWAARREMEHMQVENAQGVVALVTAPRELDDRAMDTVARDPEALVVVLDGITDPQNFGAAARSAEAAGVSLLVARKHRAAPMSPAAVKASAGALLHLPVARVVNIARAIDRLHEGGFRVVGLDQRADVSIQDADPPGRPLALVLGAEDKGISRLVRESCDELVAIPMLGRTASLNASAALAAGLFGFALRLAARPEPIRSAGPDPEAEAR
jgi:23S rRNA (guanosine2251-2'-O)-methyltransferase